MAALKKADEAKFKAICTAVRTDGAYIEAGENDNLIVQKLAANPGTLGIFGYSFLEENASKVKGVTINGVAPTYATISSFSYPGARPLYIYVKNAHVRAIPAIRAFVAEITKESAIGPQAATCSPAGWSRRRTAFAPAPSRPRARCRRSSSPSSNKRLTDIWCAPPTRRRAPTSPGRWGTWGKGID